MIKHHTYVSADSRDGVVKSLEEALIKLIKWFSDRLMKSNAAKCRLLFNKNNTVNRRIENFGIKLLTMRNSYNSHVSDLRKKASKKVHSLARVTPYMNISKRRFIVLLWTLFFNHSRVNHIKIAGLHESCLRIIYSDKISSFGALLGKDGSEFIHT